MHLNNGAYLNRSKTIYLVMKGKLFENCVVLPVNYFSVMPGHRAL